MSFVRKDTQQKFPFSYDDVFSGILSVSPTIGFKVKSEDRVIGRITAKTDASTFSWGENLTFVVEKIDDLTTQVSMTSALKVGANFAGAHRHVKNFEKLFEALSAHLQASSR
ncbi:MAG TPA: hypothetical protein VII83_00155 [Gaiellaceae bacterium]|jgi:hypothetical protein